MWKIFEPRVQVVERVIERVVEKPIEREMDEIELSAKLADKLGDIQSIEITSEGAKELFEELSKVNGLLDYLRDAMVNDIKRYFAAQNDHEREIIRGGFSRTAYIRSRILDVMKN